MGPTNTNTLASSSTVAPKKRGIKAIFIVGAILIVVLIVFITILATNNSAQTTPDATSTPVVTVSDLKISFTNLSKALIYDDANFNKAPNFSSNPNNWQITKIANSSNATSQAAYAETLLGLQKVFAASLENYLLQYPDDDLSALSENGTNLNAKIIAAVLYLRGNEFAATLPSQYLENPDEVNTIIKDEFSLDYGITDITATNVIDNTYFYYMDMVNRLRFFSGSNCINKNNAINDICVLRLRENYEENPELAQIDYLAYIHASSANDAFSILVTELPSVMNNFNSSIGEVQWKNNIQDKLQ